MYINIYIYGSFYFVILPKHNRHKRNINQFLDPKINFGVPNNALWVPKMHSGVPKMHVWYPKCIFGTPKCIVGPTNMIFGSSFKSLCDRLCLGKITK